MSQPPPLTPFWNDSQTVLLRKILTNLAYFIQGGGGTIPVFVPAPASSGAAGTAGQIAYDSDYLYVCVAANTWRRVPISDWA